MSNFFKAIFVKAFFAVLICAYSIVFNFDAAAQELKGKSASKSKSVSKSVVKKVTKYAAFRISSK